MKDSTTLKKRSQFSSKIGFLMASAGCAVGVGNIWNFPIRVAENGGAAFVLVYCILSLLLAYPCLVAELNIGRLSQKNSVDAMGSLSEKKYLRRLGRLIAWCGLFTMGIIYSFYSVVGGWFIDFTLSSLFDLVGFSSLANDVTSFSVSSNLIGTIIFMLLTTMIVAQGVQNGIERWSTRLMPLLFILLFGLIFLVFTKKGALDGLKVYIMPDFSKVFDKNLIMSALGQSFFSLSLGLGCMMTYGSYMSQKVNLPKEALKVTFVDTFVAILAGLMIIPAMYVLIYQGVNIYDDSHHLVKSNTLVFQVLPNLFNSFGIFANALSLIFFLLLSIAALTSSISMLEPAVSVFSERLNFSRKSASWCITSVSMCLSAVIISDIDSLLGLAIRISTEYMQPMICLLVVFFGGWIIRQDVLLKYLSTGNTQFNKSLFWLIWPWYVRFICPFLIVLLVLRAIFF